MPTSAESNQRLLTLDAMRGLAALAVLILHFQSNGVLAPVAYLAVDFFFLLSGFVIANTYAKRFASGLSFSDFSASRIIRIYPLFFVGFLVGIARRFGEFFLDRPGKLPGTDLLQAAPFELFMIPSPITQNLFTFNGPAWSLFFEMAINFIYAAFLIRASTLTLKICVLVFGALLFYQGLSVGSLDFGIHWSGFFGGFCRVGFSFILGVIISQKYAKQPPASALFLLPCVVLTAFLMAPSAGSWQFFYDIFFVFIICPILLWSGTKFNPPKKFEAVCKWLGDLSYPIYAIHYPMMFLYLFVVKKAGLHVYLQLPLFIVFIFFITFLLNKYFDAPIRSWLTKKKWLYQSGKAISAVKS